jgi:hypothetical protein
MASTNGVIFPESMADILTNPVDICFGSMPTTSTAPATCLVIEGNPVTTNQQIKTDLSAETHRHTPSDLIKVYERVKRPRMTPSASRMPLGCHTRLSEENQVHTYMHARITFHAYSDI